MRKKLFGANIAPDCTYCEYFIVDNQASYCMKKKAMKNGKCKAFKYDPLMRTPKVTTFKRQYTAEDFKL